MSIADSNGALPEALPPRSDTRPPTWTLPDGATDTHFHVFGPTATFPFSPKRRYDAPEAPFEQWQHMASICGLTRGVVVQGSIHGSDNAAIVDAIARGDGSIKGIAKISREMSRDDLVRLRDAGVVGARFSILEDRPGTVDDIVWAAPLLESLGWSIDLHLSPRALLQNETIIRSLQIPVVIDHLAKLRPRDGVDHPAMELLLHLLEDERFWVKIASVQKSSDLQPDDAPAGTLPYTDMVPLARAAVANAPDRVLWGSDYPHGNIYDARKIPNEGDLLDIIPEFAPDPVQRRKLLVDNPARLYGFSS